MERFVAGSSKQLRLVHLPDKFPQFQVRTLAANGDVWTGRGMKSHPIFRCWPNSIEVLAHRKPSSTAIRIRYGAFSDYTGADLPSEVMGWYDGVPWQNIAGDLARLKGERARDRYRDVRSLCMRLN